jgi:hypothetical protein
MARLKGPQYLSGDLVDTTGVREVVRANLTGAAYAVLEMRVSERVANRMSNQQLDEFEKYIDAKDEDGAKAWLQTPLPRSPRCRPN